MTDTHSLANQAYSVIRKDILTCELEPGSRIAQSQMVERYNFGTTPIREALKRLEQEGFVQSLPRFGYLIAPITIKDVEDLYNLRLILEKSSIRQAIQRISDQQIEQIRAMAEFTYTFKDHESYLAFLENNVNFHVTIALTSGNRRLAEMVGSTLSAMTRIFILGLTLRDSGEEMHYEHVALAQAISARDVLLAEQLVEDQINLSRRRVVERLIQRQNEAALEKIGL